ncbi:MAG TPA: alpha amylase N-terminal ig-like domain-containing protein [Fimbriimonas sp.]|nr:alpha amylase N-terminal ig-like domain-containing protein [Fimbriimonas sp.]
MIAALVALAVETVHLVYKTAEAPKAVYAVGDFNDWKTPGLPLRQEGGSWKLDLKVDPGVYKYVFLAEGQSLPKGDELKKAEQLLAIPPPDYAKHVAEKGDGIITQSGVRHRPDAHDTSRFKTRAFDLTLRTRRDDVESVSVMAWNEGEAQKIYPMALKESDPLFDYYRVKIVVQPDQPFLYRFLLNDGRGSRAYDASGLSQGLIGGDPFKQSPFSYKDPGS